MEHVLPGQLYLFNEVPIFPYNGLPPYEKTSQTSKEAAESITDRLGELQSEVLEFIRSKGDYGATADECETSLQMSGNTLRPRKRELELKGMIVPLGIQRKTISGRLAEVYVTKEFKHKEIEND